MTTSRISGTRVAIMVADGFEEVELTWPRRALEAAGATTHIVSPEPGHVRSWRRREWGGAFPVDLPLARAEPEDFDALLLPGGLINPDRLRMNGDAIFFALAFLERDMPVASLCHGPCTLIETGLLKGRRMTSSPSLQTDLENAGASWLNGETVVDGNLVTSRGQEDIPAFNREMIACLAVRGRQAPANP